jgi:glycosyltransferase involved in cell wall biosynthesis
VSARVAVNGSFLGQPTTGVQRFATELIKALRELGIEDLVVLAPNGYQEEKFFGYRVLGDSLPWRRHMWLWEQVRLPYLMRKSGAKLLWSPCNTGPLFVRQQVVTVHDAALFANPAWFSHSLGTFYRLLLPALCRIVIKVLTVSEFSSDELTKYRVAPKQRVFVIPGGVGNEFSATRPLRIDGRASERFVLCVGSRDPRKNVFRLIQAWELIDENKREGTKLVIVGGKARMLAEETPGEIPESVKFVGYVSDNELINRYRQAEFFVYPSLYEGFGLPPLEAMASGTPVITSNVASLPEVVADAALLVNPYDIVDMARDMQMLLSNAPLRAELRKRGYKRAKEFTWLRTADLTWKALGEAAQLG